MFGIPTIPVVRTTLTSTASSVTLTYSSPGGTPRHLILRTSTIATSGNPNVFIRLNGDSGSNYNAQVLHGYSTTTAAWAGTSNSSLQILGNIDDLSNAHSVSETLFPDAFSTRTHKSALCISGRHEEVVNAGGGRWENTAAITSVEVFVDSSTFTAGSIFELAVVDEAYVIDETILTGAADFDHGSISAADGDLLLIGNLRGDVDPSQIEEVALRFNGDTGGNYIRQRLRANNGTNIAAYASTSPVVAHSAATDADANSFSGLIVQIPNFSDGSNDRNALTLGGGHFSDSDQIVGIYNTRWNDTSAINRVEVYGLNKAEFVANSMLSIYVVPKNLITRTELGSDTSSVTFSSIPASYDHLEVTVYARTTRDAINDVVNMTFNTDTTASNYNHQELQAAGTTMSANTDAANVRIGVYPSGTEGANEFGVGTTTIYNYKMTDRHKSRLTVMGSTERVLMYSRRWEDTSAINQIVLTPNAGTNFLAGSVFSLRGITASTSDIAELNTIATADIQAFNGITVANAQELNGVTF